MLPPHLQRITSQLVDRSYTTGPSTNMMIWQYLTISDMSIMSCHIHLPSISLPIPSRSSPSCRNWADPMVTSQESTQSICDAIDRRLKPWPVPVSNATQWYTSNAHVPQMHLYKVCKLDASFCLYTRRDPHSSNTLIQFMCVVKSIIIECSSYSGHYLPHSVSFCHSSQCFEDIFTFLDRF